jgi:hypothetical protein
VVDKVGRKPLVDQKALDFHMARAGRMDLVDRIELAVRIGQVARKVARMELAVHMAD